MGADVHSLDGFLCRGSLVGKWVEKARVNTVSILPDSSRHWLAASRRAVFLRSVIGWKGTVGLGGIAPIAPWASRCARLGGTWWDLVGLPSLRRGRLSPLHHRPLAKPRVADSADNSLFSWPSSSRKASCQGRGGNQEPNSALDSSGFVSTALQTSRQASADNLLLLVSRSGAYASNLQCPSDFF